MVPAQEFDGSSTGIVNLDGGSIIAAELNMQAGGAIDVNATGTLVLTGDQRTKINGYISSGWITAENGTADVVLRYDGVNTTVQSPLNPGLVYAWNPKPTDGQTDVDLDINLTWSPGSSAAKHDIYFGTDANNLTAIGTDVEPNHIDPGQLELGTTYYWRVDEVNGVDKWTGDLWSFTTRSFTPIEDFESYTDTAELLNTWKDGTVDSSSGSYIYIYIGELTHGGTGCLEYNYDNTGTYVAPLFSEIERSSPVSDMTANNMKALDLWFDGDGSNAAEKMYVALSDGTETATVFHPDPNAALEADWTVWRVALSDFTDANPDLDLTNISKIYIGFGDKSNPTVGGMGTVYFDDVALFGPRCFNRPAQDQNGDCIVNFEDFAYFAAEWLQDGFWP